MLSLLLNPSLALLAFSLHASPLSRSSSAVSIQRTMPPLAMALPLPGSVLPMPEAGLESLEGVPSTFATLSELGGGADMLALVMSSEGAMSDPLRQTLVGLQEAQLNNAATAAVSLVSPKGYAKLARKASVEFPLLSDAGRFWLEPLGDRHAKLAAQSPTTQDR